MYQVSDGASFLEKTFEFIICYPGLQQLDGYLCIEIHVLTKVNIGKAAPANAGGSGDNSPVVVLCGPPCV